MVRNLDYFYSKGSWKSSSRFYLGYVCVQGRRGNRTRTCFPFCKALLASVSLAGLTHHIGPGSLSGLLPPVTCALAFLLLGSICPCCPGLLQIHFKSLTKTWWVGCFAGRDRERETCLLGALSFPPIPSHPLSLLAHRDRS